MKKITTIQRLLLADKETPTGLYLKLREHYPELLLLESNDHHNRENAYSFLCFSPLINLQIHQNQLKVRGLIHQDLELQLHAPLQHHMQNLQETLRNHTNKAYHHINGLFGFTSFEAATHFDTGILPHIQSPQLVPELNYSFYRYLLVFNHHNHTLQLLENLPEGERSNIDEILTLLQKAQTTTYPFEIRGEEQSNLTDEAFENLVTKGKKQCARGDVFQIVYSRQFSQGYNGDTFSIYRSLRSINPSPYLFYFDYGNYTIIGSSPEAQLQVKNNKAQIHPIAGTFPRSGSDEQDQITAQKLIEDPKENAEHVMLVDLARNDLNRNTIDVKVSKFKTTETFSHVIHMVSVVEGTLTNNLESFEVYSKTFPAGTLSGAPKIKAMELIRENENQRREFYGGAIGYLALNGDLNHAIMIRSLLAKNNQLYYQAGAGIVIHSDENKERQEVNHKLAAVRKAIENAQHITS